MDTNNDKKKYKYLSPYFIDVEIRANSDFVAEQFYKKFDSLPEALQRFMQSTATSQFIEQLITLHELQLKHGQELARIIRDICLGDVYHKDLHNAVIKRLRVDPAVGQQIAQQIQTQLFAPVQKEIEQVQAPLAQQFESVRMPGLPPQRPPDIAQKPATDAQQPGTPPKTTSQTEEPHTPPEKNIPEVPGPGHTPTTPSDTLPKPQAQATAALFDELFGEPVPEDNVVDLRNV